MTYLAPAVTVITGVLPTSDLRNNVSQISVRSRGGNRTADEACRLLNRPYKASPDGCDKPEPLRAFAARTHSLNRCGRHTPDWELAVSLVTSITCTSSRQAANRAPSKAAGCRSPENHRAAFSYVVSRR